MTSSAIDFNVAGIEFVAAMLLAASFYFWLPAARLRQLVWASSSFFVFWLVLPNGISWAALAIFLLSGYLTALMLRRWPSGWLLGAYIAMLLAAFVVLKQYAVLEWPCDALDAFIPGIVPKSSRQILGIPIRDGVLLHAVKITGLSYMLFRQIHVLVDAAQGQVERISLWSYVNYQINLFTLLAGPIQRFQDFEAQWAELAPVLADSSKLLQNCLRLLWGVMKIALIAPLFYKGWDELQINLVYNQVAGWKYLVEFAVVFYFYPIYLYCNFSGYCDIVIAAGRFFGMNLPENFNRPWLARNAIEFWTRWHITLGLWIRDYLFMPMYKPIVEHWPKRAPRLAFVCYFLAFTAAGVWHGTSVNYLIYGLLQGLGVSVTKLYENAVVAARGRNGWKTYLRSPGIRVAAVLLNFHFQCLTLVFFSHVNYGDAWSMLRGVVTACRT